MGSKLPKIHSNWKVVVLALVVATTFWFFNALSKNYEAQVQYPLEFQFQRDSLIIVDPLPKFIKLEVSGGGWDLLRRTTKIGAKPIIIQLDNPTEVKLLPKNNVQRIVADQLKEITVKYILTDSLFINIEPKETRLIKVIIDSAFIDLEKNHRITSVINQNIDTISVTGPTSLIRQLKSPFFVRVNEEEIDSDFDDYVPITLANKKIVQSSPNEILVKFAVEEFVNKTIEIPVEKLNFENSEEIMLSDSTVEVSFTIAKSKESSVDASNFSVTADFSAINKSDSTIQLLPVVLSEFATDIEFSKETVKVEYGGD